MTANEPQKKHLIEWCFVSSWEWSNFVSLCRKMITSDRLLTEARRKRHPCMLLECVRIPRACAEIWSSHTANMNNDLIKNYQFACDGVQIPWACAEKMNLKEPHNGSILLGVKSSCYPCMLFECVRNQRAYAGKCTLTDTFEKAVLFKNGCNNQTKIIRYLISARCPVQLYTFFL